uniref:ankyrin repeat and SOCS box protein 17-like n=1 Tax=Centroberyx gerrardi TaxID=166262 RepID=UPI003AB0BB40
MKTCRLENFDHQITTMQDSEDEQGHSNDNVFVTLVAGVIQTPRVPRPLGHNTYQTGIYRTLGRVLRNVTSEKLDSTMSDFVRFAHFAHVRMGTQLYMEFVNVCTNTILHLVCERRTSAHIVRRLMEIISGYALNQTDHLALAWRRFTPSYSPMGGMTPVMLVAQNHQFDALKILLQYGMLERERRPSYVIISLLFDFPRLEEEERNLCCDSLMRELKACVALCFRVLIHVSIAEIEMQIIYGRQPLIVEWRDHIPRNRSCDPCELSHLCRAVIRRRLLVLGLLPNGINALFLPRCLQSYLNLEH